MVGSYKKLDILTVSKLLESLGLLSDSSYLSVFCLFINFNYESVDVISRLTHLGRFSLLSNSVLWFSRVVCEEKTQKTRNTQKPQKYGKMLII